MTENTKPNPCPHAGHCSCINGGRPEPIITSIGNSTFTGVPRCHQDVRDHVNGMNENEILLSLTDGKGEINPAGQRVPTLKKNRRDW